jgi:hypothetical protein
MSRENVELAKALLPEPGTDIAPLFRDDTGFALVREALARSLRTTSRVSWFGPR